MQPVKHFAELFKYVEEHYQNTTSFNDFHNEKWASISTRQFIEEVKALTYSLIRLGVKKRDRIGILAAPSGRWSIAEFAAIFAGAIPVPIFGNISEENFVFECTQADVRLLFVSGETQWSLCQRNKSLFDTIIGLDFDEDIMPDNAVRYSECLLKGRQEWEADPAKFERLLQEIQPDDVAVIIYTSGSTGVPKGAVLTQTNVCCILHDPRMNWSGGGDRYLSILPLAHVFGHVINLFAIYWNISIYYFNDHKRLGEACRMVHPTVMVVVPRVLEKVYAKFMLSLKEASWLKRTIGLWALRRASVHKLISHSSPLYKIADHLVYAKLREALGGSLKIVVSGGAATAPDLLYFFCNIGVTILQGWGMTEACPGTCNSFEHNRLGTVGDALTGQEIRIADNGELLIRGTLVMREYLMNPEATATVIDREGWLHTGDKGSIDDKGFLTIIGRIKELFKTSTGEYVAPVPIEQALCSHPLIEMALVIAEGRKYVSALLFPNPEQLKHYKKQYGQESISDEDFLNSWVVRKEIESHIDDINQHLNHAEQVHDYKFILELPSIESGEMTPSMKLRREVITRKYKKLIEEMYHHMEIV